MATSLGTYLGTALGTQLGTGVDEELAQLELYLARSLFSWIRADYRTEASGKVTQFNDKVLLPSQGGLAGNARSIDPNHAFAQATGAKQVAAIAANAFAGGREAALFLGGQCYASTLAASNWSVNDGSGWRIWSSYYPSGAGNTVFWSTWASGAPAVWQGTAAAGGGPYLFGTSTAGAYMFTLLASGNSNANVMTYVDSSFATADTPDVTVRQKTTTLYTADAAVAPTATPGTTMILGALDNTASVSGLVAGMTDFMAVKSTSGGNLLTNVRRYLLLRYGLS